MDDSSMSSQQNSQQNQNAQEIQHRQKRQRQAKQKQQQQAASSATCELESQMEEPHDLPPMQKKHRLDIGQEHVANMQQQQQQRRQHEALHPMSRMNQSFAGAICARRLMQYICHHRQLSKVNNILSWRKFVDEYFVPCATKRLCLSSYHIPGDSSLGVFLRAATVDPWHCNICGLKLGSIIEISADILPRLSEIEFDSGVIDELLFVDEPREFKLPLGLVMLEYEKAIEEIVYEHLRFVREGHLRIIFTPNLKILSWEFCVQRHEELFPCRILAPQVNQLVQVANKYLTAVNESGSSGVSPQDLQTNCDMFVTASRQLVKNLDLQLLNDLGFSKRYVRNLQISDVVSSLKDLMDFSREHNIGPIESLKEYPQQATTATKLQVQNMQEMERPSNTQGLSTDQTTLNETMAMHPGLSSHLNNNLGCRAMNNCEQKTAVALSNYKNLPRQRSMNTSFNSRSLPTEVQGRASSHSSPFQAPVSPVLGSLPNAPVNSLSSTNQQPSHMLQQNQQQQSAGGTQLQPHVIQQMRQETKTTDGGIQQQPLCQMPQETMTKDGGIQQQPLCQMPQETMTKDGGIQQQPQLRHDTNENAADDVLNGAIGNDLLLDELSKNPYFSELVQDLPGELAEYGVLGSELGKK